MAWPERAAISLLMLVVLLGIFLSLIATAPGPDSWANPAAAIDAIGCILLYGVLPLWGVFRIVDFLTGGPARRRWAVKARIVRY